MAKAKTSRKTRQPQLQEAGCVLLVSVIEGPSHGTVFQHTTTPVKVGRKKTCDAHINDSCISENHAEFLWEDGHWHIRDLGSSNGTTVNGEKLEIRGAPHQLKSADRIVFGTESVALIEIPMEMTMQDYMTCMLQKLKNLHEVEISMRLEKLRAATESFSKELSEHRD